MKKSILLFTCLFSGSLAFSQYRWEVGGQIGVANYLGEIGGKEKTRRDFIMDMKLSQSRSALGAFMRYKIHPDILVRGSVSWNRISGADKFSSNPARRSRNLSFRNDIVEASMVGQYVFYDIADLGRTYRYRNDFKAYVFTGVAAAHHSPQTEYNGKWVDLQPLHTEGQGVVKNAPGPYSRLIVAAPTGAGFFFTFDKKYRIGWELNWRTTLTDYLDDVSTVYADPALLESDEARDLANRNDELTYEDGASGPAAENYYPHAENGVMKYPKRGDPSHNDSYLSTMINGSMIIDTKSVFAQRKYRSYFKKHRYVVRTIRVKV